MRSILTIDDIVHGWSQCDTTRHLCKIIGWMIGLLGGGNSSIFSILTIIFFKWVVQPPTSYSMYPDIFPGNLQLDDTDDRFVDISWQLCGFVVSLRPPCWFGYTLVARKVESSFAPPFLRTFATIIKKRCIFSIATWYCWWFRNPKQPPAMYKTL